MNPVDIVRRKGPPPLPEVPRPRVNPVDIMMGRPDEHASEVLPGPKVNGQTLAWKGAAAFLAGPLCVIGAITHPHPWIRVGLGVVGTAVTVVDGSHVFRKVFQKKEGT